MTAVHTARTPWERQTVARRINVPASEVSALLSQSSLPPAGHLLPLGGLGELRLDAPFAPPNFEQIPTWSATGRLSGRGLRIARFARIELRLTAWSDNASELRICPVARHVDRWGERRQRRYFALAHQVANDIARLITTAAAEGTPPARNRLPRLAARRPAA